MSDEKIKSISIAPKGTLLLAMHNRGNSEKAKAWSELSTGEQYATLDKEDLIYYVDVMFKYNKGPLRLPYVGTEEEERESRTRFQSCMDALEAYENQYGRDSFILLLKKYPIEEAINRIYKLQSPMAEQ